MVIAILIVLNLAVGQFDKKFDVTKDKIYSISDSSKSVLDEIQGEVNIYALFKTGQEDETVMEILENYAKYSDKVKVEAQDLYLHPEIATKYSSEDTNVEEGCLVVECGDKFKIIQSTEYYKTQTDYYTGSTQITGVNVEQTVTSAIKWATMESEPAIYAITGHGELDFANAFAGVAEQIELANYKLESLNLLQKSEIPEDCALLFITTGARDYSQDEVDCINSYLAKDGRAIFALGGVPGQYNFVTKEEFPNLMSIIEAYGVTLSDYIVSESDEDYNFQKDIYSVYSVLNEHDMTSAMLSKDYRPLLPYVQAVKTLDVKKASVTVSTIASSSDTAYIKDVENATSANFEQGDEQGRFDLCVAVSDSTYTDAAHETRLVVIGSIYSLVDNVDIMVNYANSTLIMNAINWLDNESGGSVYIAAKSLEGNYVEFDSGTQIRIFVISMLVLPLIVIGIGLMIWLRRKHK